MKTLTFLCCLIFCATAFSQDTTTYSILLDGSFKAQDKSDPSKTGAAGLSSKSDDVDFSVLIRTGSLGDKLSGSKENSFGAAVLNPEKASVSVNVDIFAKTLFTKKLGGRFTLGINKVNWVYDDSNNNTSQETDGIILSSDAFVSWSPILIPGHKNTIRASLNLGATCRIIGGTLASGSNKIFRVSTLGTTETNFYGVYFSTFIQINDIQVNFSFPWIFNNDVDGLSNGQIVLSFGINGDIIKF